MGPPCCKCSALSSVSVEKWLSLISLTLVWYSTIFFDQKLAKNLRRVDHTIKRWRAWSVIAESPLARAFSKLPVHYIACNNHHEQSNPYLCDSSPIHWSGTMLTAGSKFIFTIHQSTPTSSGRPLSVLFLVWAGTTSPSTVLICPLSSGYQRWSSLGFSDTSALPPIFSVISVQCRGDRIFCPFEGGRQRSLRAQKRPRPCQPMTLTDLRRGLG